MNRRSHGSRTRTGIVRLALLLVCATCAGWFFQRIGSPLPWMIGPLVATAFLSCTAVLTVAVPDTIRPFGQVVVASQVGLAFSPAAAEKLVLLAPAIVGTAVATLACILLVTFALARWSRMSLAQGFLAAVPTSPVEAAAMAAKLGIDPTPVIFSQTLRLSAIVLVLPLSLYIVEGWPGSGGSLAATAPGSFSVRDIVLLAALGFGAMHLFRLLRIPNPNFLGPLAAAAALAVTGFAPAPYPAPILAAAQIVLGCWLGSNFRRDFVTRSGRLLLTSMVTILTLLALCSASAIAIASMVSLDWRLAVLGAAPGGVTEMALTAKFLGEDATIVTAFHIARIFILMPNIPWIVALIARRERRSAKPPGDRS